jgi:hypothetical protein
LTAPETEYNKNYEITRVLEKRFRYQYEFELTATDAADCGFGYLTTFGDSETTS